MAFTNITLLKRPSDLVIGHYINAFNFDEANVTPGVGAAPLGTIVFRAKGLTKKAPWARVTAAGDVVETNEYAVLWGDGYAFRSDFTLSPIVANRYNAVVIKRGPAEFKEFYIKELYATLLGADPYDILKQLMADQGLVVHDDITDYKHTI